MDRNNNIKAAASCSAGRPAHEHDIRQYTPKNVDHVLTPDNVSLIDRVGPGRTVRQYIDELMQPSIDQYNETQKRKDRKINVGYSEWHKSQPNKGDLVYEWCLQYGSGEDAGGRYYAAVAAAALDPDNEEKRAYKEELKNEFIKTYSEWVRKIEEEYKIHIAWAQIHFDEGFKDLNGKPVPMEKLKDCNPNELICGTPHCHVGIVPISKYEFKRGPKTQVSLAQVLEQIKGCERIFNLGAAKNGDKNVFQQGKFFQMFHEYQSRYIQEELGYSLKEPSPDKKPHQTVELFKATKYLEKVLEQIQAETTQAKENLERTTNEIYELEDKKDSLELEIDVMKTILLDQTKEQVENDLQLDQQGRQLSNQTRILNEQTQQIQQGERKLKDLDEQQKTTEQMVSQLRQEKNSLQTKTQQLIQEKQLLTEDLEPVRALVSELNKENGAFQKYMDYQRQDFRIEPDKIIPGKKAGLLSQGTSNQYVYEKEKHEEIQRLYKGAAVATTAHLAQIQLNKGLSEAEELISSDRIQLQKKIERLEGELQYMEFEKDVYFNAYREATKQTLPDVIYNLAKRVKKEILSFFTEPMSIPEKTRFIDLFKEKRLTYKDIDPAIYGMPLWTVQKMLDKLEASENAKKGNNASNKNNRTRFYTPTQGRDGQELEL